MDRSEHRHSVETDRPAGAGTLMGFSKEESVSDDDDADDDADGDLLLL
jgi:hypothetical protein